MATFLEGLSNTLDRQKHKNLTVTMLQAEKNSTKLLFIINLLTDTFTASRKDQPSCTRVHVSNTVWLPLILTISSTPLVHKLPIPQIS